MLLKRKVGESLRIGDQVVITVLAVRGQQVQVAIRAPESVNVWREESYQPRKGASSESEPTVVMCTWLGQTVVAEAARST
jgi:carbon storage regulator